MSPWWRVNVSDTLMMHLDRLTALQFLGEATANLFVDVIFERWLRHGLVDALFRRSADWVARWTRSMVFAPTNVPLAPIRKSNFHCHVDFLGKINCPANVGNGGCWKNVPNGFLKPFQNGNAH